MISHVAYDDYLFVYLNLNYWLVLYLFLWHMQLLSLLTEDKLWILGHRFISYLLGRTGTKKKKKKQPTWRFNRTQRRKQDDTEEDVTACAV